MNTCLLFIFQFPCNVSLRRIWITRILILFYRKWWFRLTRSSEVSRGALKFRSRWVCYILAWSWSYFIHTKKSSINSWFCLLIFRARSWSWAMMFTTARSERVRALELWWPPLPTTWPNTSAWFLFIRTSRNCPRTCAWTRRVSEIFPVNSTKTKDLQIMLLFLQSVYELSSWRTAVFRIVSFCTEVSVKFRCT